MHQLYGIAGSIFHSVKPIRDALYRRFVKSFPCCACKAWWGIDPCHTGVHSDGKKGDDTKCIALCRSCHRAFDASPVKFAAKHHLDVEALIRMYQELYALQFPNRKPP